MQRLQWPEKDLLKELSSQREKIHPQENNHSNQEAAHHYDHLIKHIIIDNG